MKKIGNKAVINYLEGYLSAILDIQKSDINVFPFIRYMKTTYFDFEKYIAIENINLLGSVEKKQISIKNFEKWLEKHLRLNDNNVNKILAFKIIDEIELNIFNDLYRFKPFFYKYQELDTLSNQIFCTEIVVMQKDTRCLIIGFFNLCDKKVQKNSEV